MMKTHYFYCRCRSKPVGFTLIEVMVSLLLLAVLFSSILVAFDRTSDRIIYETLMNRASGIAQDRMEMLITTHQEPNAVDLTGQDERDPLFTWQIDLRRVTPGSLSLNATEIENTVIEAKVTVKCDSPDMEKVPRVELVRYFSSMMPRPGQPIAVPLSPDARDPLWLIELRDELGREPTIDEIMERMLETEGLPADILNELTESDVGEDQDSSPANPN